MLVVYSFAQCATLQPSVKAPFTITEATYQNWVGERPEVYGANLSICIEALNGVFIQQVYYVNAKHTPSIATRKGKTYVLVNSSASLNYHIEELNLAYNKKLEESATVNKEFPFPLKLMKL